MQLTKENHLCCCVHNTQRLCVHTCTQKVSHTWIRPPQLEPT